MSSMVIKADTKDIPELIKVVNAAYRGEESKKGWTSPAYFVGGDIRIDEQALMKMFQNSLAVLLKYVEDEKIVGCVYLEIQGHDLYLGMLSVLPDLQGKSIGKKLLVASEEYAKKNKMKNIVINVITRQEKLISWYERHGYMMTSETKPYPEDGKFGKPLEKLVFAILKKKFSN
jgi:ribosomal protein S18 acetylase RimI-like enzyme